MMSRLVLLSMAAAHLLPPLARRLHSLLVAVLLLRASYSHAGLPTTYDGSMCSESFLCGSVEIRYPFYLANATQSYSGNFSCGYTDLNISCKSDGQQQSSSWTPTINLGGEDYTVKNISYEDQTMVVADSFVLGGGVCPLVRHNVSFDDEAWLRLRNIKNQNNLTFFFDCDPVPSPGSEEFDEYRIGCNGFNSPTFVFTPADDDDLGRRDNTQEKELAAHCKVIYVPVNAELLRVMASNRTTFTSGGYGVVLNHGFELGWSVIKTDQCPPCEESGGRCSYDSQNRGFLGCLCHHGKVGNPDCKNISATITSASSSTARHDNKRTITYIVASTSGLLILCLLILAFFLTRKYGLLPFKSKEEPRIRSFLQKNGSLHPKRYSYADVKRMTKSFAVKLGQGGFGAVYRGNLYDGRQVAVKMLNDTKGDGEEFMNEVASISRTSHVNVVSLLGFCLRGSKRALIYEYMPNGSLERYAFKSNMNSDNILTWKKLFDITIGIARGLEYLHRGCNTRIVHFDIKPHNILLDQDFCPKISDFGLAKICTSKESVISIVGARGTIGYIAPEVYSKQFGTISSKSDVYSYGMMVLEMLGARDKNISANNGSSSQYFPQWIYEHLDEYCISASEKINGGSEITELVRKMIVIGLWCIQLLPTDRPTMTRVVEMLEGSTTNLELPPKCLLS